MAKFVLFRGTNGHYFFVLKAPNGETICTSEGYTTKQNALNGIAAVRLYAPVAQTVDMT